MADGRRVDMIRLERQEEVYDREEVLGRDTSSVFPKTAAEQASTSQKLNSERIAEAIGARKFISETELQQIKSTRGTSVEDGTVAALKPLSEVLREAKEAKEAEFQNKWKEMKTGKNRALEPDELAFMDALRDDELARERETRMQEQKEMDDYRAALNKAREEAEASERMASGVKRPPPSLPKPGPKLAAKVKPMIVVKPKAHGGGAGGAKNSAGGDEQAAKRTKTDVPDNKASHDSDDSGGGGGLPGLIGDYASDDEG